MKNRYSALTVYTPKPDSIHHITIVCTRKHAILSREISSAEHAKACAIMDLAANLGNCSKPLLHYKGDDMKFTVHTNKGRYIIEAPTPDEARLTVRRKHPAIVIKKVKVKK